MLLPLGGMSQLRDILVAWESRAKVLITQARDGLAGSVHKRAHMY